jgi:hypothetical protein
MQIVNEQRRTMIKIKDFKDVIYSEDSNIEVKFTDLAFDDVAFEFHDN